MSCPFSVGTGFDVHRLAVGYPLRICGVEIPYEMGLEAHSDGDVALHALCDALLGAANMRDIGYHFPDTGAAYKDIDSKILLQKTMQLLADNAWSVGNVDATICAEQPKLNPHIEKMKAVIAPLLSISEEDISIKATTTEKLGFTGRQEGISAYAVVLIEKKGA